MSPRRPSAAPAAAASARSALVPGALVLALAACASPPTRFYTLEAAAPSQLTPAPVGPIAPLRVEAVHWPAELDRPELIRRVGAGEVAVDDFARWSAPLGRVAVQTLTADLTARLPAGTVIFPAAPRPAGARGLVVDVLALGAAGGQATMDVSWSLTGAAASANVGRDVAARVSPPRTYRLSVPSAGATPAGTAADLGALLARLADRIAADLAAGGA